MELRRMSSWIATLAVLTFAIVIDDLALAKELSVEGQVLNSNNLPDVKSSGKRKGGPPPPPADPYCPNGSVGPITRSTEQRACTINGQEGIQTCSKKMVKCLSGPGEAEYAFSENCGSCIASPKKPKQTETPTGR